MKKFLDLVLTSVAGAVIFYFMLFGVSAILEFITNNKLAFISFMVAMVYIIGKLLSKELQD